MKILHVTESIKGGIATHLSVLWQEHKMTDAVGEICFAIPVTQHGELPTVPAEAMRRLPDTRRNLSGLFKHAKATARLIACEKPDIVHAHSTFAGVAVRVLKYLGLCPVPVCYCPHGWGFDRSLGPVHAIVYRTLERTLAPASQAILCISKHELRQARLVGVSRRRLYLAYNGLPAHCAAAERHAPADETTDTPLQIAFAGRMDRQKGFDVLLAALESVQRPVHLTCIGAPVLHDQPPPKIAGNDRHTIRLTGWLTPQDVARELRRADVVVVPSRWEGFGLVAIEAMREGTPVVASRCGGLGELIVDGITGRLVPPGDVPALASAIGNLCREELQAWGIMSRSRFAAGFTADRMTSRIHDIYAGLHEAR